MKQIKIFKAQAIGDHFPASVNIIIDRIAPEVSNLSDWKDFTKEEAHTLADALFSSLPGGTIDALLIEMLERTRSLLVVSHRCSAPDLRAVARRQRRQEDLLKSLQNRFKGHIKDLVTRLEHFGYGYPAEYPTPGETQKSFDAWVIDQAAAGDSEADEYLGLVNQV